jgi:hypothetical protein
MRARFPDLRRTLDSPWWVTWVGPVKPLHAVHTIRIGYVRRYWLGDIEITNGYIPEVIVLEPLLQLAHASTGKAVPHVYWREDRPEHSTLCLYDPAISEWSPDEYIADTIVP